MRQIQARKHKKEHYDNMFRFYWSILLWTRREKLRGIRHTCRTLGWSKNPLSSQTEKLMAGTKFSDYLGLKHYKKAKK